METLAMKQMRALRMPSTTVSQTLPSAAAPTDPKGSYTPARPAPARALHQSNVGGLPVNPLIWQPLTNPPTPTPPPPTIGTLTTAALKLTGPPSNYAGSGMSMESRAAHPPNNVLENLAKVKLPKHHDSSYSPEEKKDDSAPAPFLDISDQSRTKVELDRRLIYGLNDPAPSSVSPDRSLLSPSVEEIPHTRTQLLHHYKKKHEFSSMLSQHVPSDVTAASNISKAQRGRSRNKKRRDRSNSNSPEQRNISGSLSPTRRVNYDQPPLDASLHAVHDENSYLTSDPVDRATTAHPSKRVHESSAISLAEDGSYISVDSGYKMERPWSQQDRATRVQKDSSVSPPRNSSKLYDQFQRPKENGAWDYDEHGYLWAEDGDLSTSNDKMALKKKRGNHQNDSNSERVTGLVAAYGMKLPRKKRHIRKKKGVRMFAETMAALGSVNFGGEGMEPTGGGVNLPQIHKGDASRSMMRQQPSGTSEDGMFRFLDSQQRVVENHVYDLTKESDYQQRKHDAIHLGIVWEIEKMKEQLPMAFLQQWGMGGEFAINKAVKVIVRVVTNFRTNTIREYWRKWKRKVDKMIELEFNQKMLLFQQSGALKTFESIGKRCLRHAQFAGFELWKEKIAEMKMHEANAENEVAAIVVQRFIKNRQAEQRSMKHMKAVVVLALHNRRMINMTLSFHNLATPLYNHHLKHKTLKRAEDTAASTIRRAWNAHQSRSGVISLIFNTRARKKEAAELLLLQMAVRVQRNWRWRNDRIGLLLFREARRKRIEAERQAKLLAEQEAMLGQQAKQRRHGAADIVRRAYRCHRFVCRFNKKAHERKKAALALQLLMHKKVNMIIRCFRTHRFLAVFNQKAHARKLRWMAEAEARALEEYNAACFLQDCYMRSRNRANMSLRFNDRKNMIKQAEVLRHQNKKVLIIQMAYNKFKGRENLQSKIMMRKLREEDEKKQRLLLAQKKAVFKQRMKASKVIQHNYRTYRFLVIFNGKARERKEMWLAQQLLEHNSSVVIQHSYRTHRFLSIFNGKTHERKQRWLAQQLLEHNSATIVQKNYRTYRFLMAFMKKTHERKKRWMREAEQKAKEEYEAMLDRQATRIQMFCQSQMEKYNQPVRILARRQLEMKRRIIREKLAAERLEKAARIVQHAWRLKGEKDMLMGRFTKRRALMQKKGDELRRNDMATKIAHAYLRHLDQKALRRRVLGRAKLHEKIAIHRARDAAARVLQRNFRLSRARFVQSLKFEQMRRRLAAERLLEEQTALAELAARRAAEARMAAEEALKQMVSQGWKLGSDPHGRNYWYNWVTGESTWVKPPGWKIKQDETWVKNTDSNGNVYYFNQLTMETKWMPPCEVCQKEGGKRICEDCDFKTYCLNCFESTHEHMNGGKDHRWKGADIDKEPLEKGEKYCIKCQVTAAKKCCKVCKDAYCERCFRDVHAVGNISKHPWVTWAEYKAGWQEVKGRVEGERNYYFNATTLESVNEKPEELMLEEELAEHKKHMQYFKENEKNKDRVKKLQEKVQQYEYEKDQLWFEMNMKKSAEAEELELLRSALEAAEAKKKDQWKKMLLHPIKFYKEWVIEQKKAQQAYRRKLLLSAKQRKTLGLNTAPAEET